ARNKICHLPENDHYPPSTCPPRWTFDASPQTSSSFFFLSFSFCSIHIFWLLKNYIGIMSHNEVQMDAHLLPQAHDLARAKAPVTVIDVRKSFFRHRSNTLIVLIMVLSVFSTSLYIPRLFNPLREHSCWGHLPMKAEVDTLIKE